VCCQPYDLHFGADKSVFLQKVFETLAFSNVDFGSSQSTVGGISLYMAKGQGKYPFRALKTPLRGIQKALLTMSEYPERVSRVPLQLSRSTLKGYTKYPFNYLGVPYKGIQSTPLTISENPERVYKVPL
jgi:hypothetical protein